ncbi:DMT family transporter [Terrihabitans rhizophilus]|uniref:DMT family transporter n=1 Tax=Terrihabitans rhizophilus TaxID=3092662 RepID=A0ABU4RX29_9HYPH|nr:DMT family transporter [Terrihabitans sp. PJ23]MDX6807466.1 DMT family transporter [Terrihabitans sp. PJ23]
MIEALRRAGTALFARPYLLLTLTSLFWAGNIVVGRLLAGDIPPVTLALLRWTGAGLIALPFAWRSLVADLPLVRRHWKIMVLFSATGIGGYNALAYWGLNYTQALNALLVQSTGPLLIALWGLVLWRETLSLRQLLGILTSLVGVAIIILRGDPVHLAELKLNPGDILTFMALVLYGLYAALLRKRPPLSNGGFLLSTIFGGIVLLLPFALLELASGARIHVNSTSVLAMLYITLFPSLIAYLFFMRSVELVGANRASPFFHLMPVFGSVIAILWLGEQAEWFHAAGFALVLAGVFVATRRSRDQEQHLST